jgi:hypothetical protein
MAANGAEIPFPSCSLGETSPSMSTEQAREMAEMARKQAAITTGETRKALLEIAQKYEAIARTAPPKQA